MNLYVGNGILCVALAVFNISNYLCGGENAPPVWVPSLYIALAVILFGIAEIISKLNAAERERRAAK